MTPKDLNFYGLKKLGYDEASIGVTGNMLADQIAIEALCLRIRHAEHEGGMGAFGHFKNYVDLLWNNPESGSMKRFVWNPWANRMLRKMLEVNELGIAGPTSAGKCLDLEKGVLMFDDSVKKAGEITTGDRVMGPDSTPRIVQEVHRGRGPMYWVKPAQGDPWLCTENHTLVLKRTIATGKAWRRLGEIVEIEAKEFTKASHTFRRSHRQFCVGVEFPAQPVELDPRVLGIWIGDGHYHHPRITVADAEVEELAYLHDWATTNGYELRRTESGCATCPSYVVKTPEGEINPFKRFVKSCREDGVKRIPRNYLINSRQVRLELLAGIIDTDGYASRTFFEVATKHAGLKDDIVFLARSLGFRVSAVHRLTTCKGKKFPSWRISICGNVGEIPTLRKKCKAKTLRMYSDCTGITLEPAGDRDWVGFSLDGDKQFLLDDFTVTHNSGPAGLYGVVSYTVDPTHTMVLVMSTTISGAKRRIWKYVLEYWESIANLPGRYMKGTNEIQGLNFNGQGYGQSSGIYLLAGEPSAEKAALDRIIGIKAPQTGLPSDDYNILIQRPEYADLTNHFDEETLRDLVPRLHNLAHDRTGRLILIIDEMTGVAESILNAVNTNLKPGNVGHFQIIGLGNPNLVYDPFGIFCKPKGGWDKVNLREDEEWETETGGLCIRFNGEQNPRIIEQDERYFWMLRKEDIDAMAARYGKDSLYYHRMALGTWCLEGENIGIYSPADIEMSGAKETQVVWGFEKPKPVSFLDPSFTAGGDLAWATFGLLGLDFSGKQILHITEGVAIKTDPTNRTLPINYQIVRQWRKECEARGVVPSCAAYDRTGGGGPFGDIVSVVWSPAVTGVSFGGSASRRPIPGEKNPATGKPILAYDRYANRATEIWHGAHPLFRSHQIYGVSDSLAKELCSRQYSKNKSAENKVLCVEGKRFYKDREGKSPDESDSFLGLVDFCRERHGLQAEEYAEVRKAAQSTETGENAWKQLRARAKRMSTPRNLKNKL